MRYGKDIILNRLYNGNYLENNLGHEIINLYKADNGENYLYLQFDGTIPSSRIGTVDSMLLVRTVEGKKMLEVLGKAEGLVEVYNSQNSSHDQQVNFIKKHDIRYGGVYLHEVFANNKSYQDVYISYKAEKVVLPSRKFYISRENSSADIVLQENNLARTGLKQYISSQTPCDYQNLIDFINNPNNWGKETDKVPTQINRKKQTVTMFDVCRINDNELAWSNALGYFMEKYPNLVGKFAKDVLHKDFHPTANFKIKRETENNIDLFIEDEKHIIVVENKIKSHINGLIFNRKSQELEQTQLKKYYDFAIEKAKQEKNKKTVSFYLLMPNYNDIDISCYEKGDKYTKIYYKQVYDFLSNQSIDDFHLQEFMTAMYPHTLEHSNDLYEVMKWKFYNMIEIIKK